VREREDETGTELAKAALTTAHVSADWSRHARSTPTGRMSLLSVLALGSAPGLVPHIALPAAHGRPARCAWACVACEPAPDDTACSSSGKTATLGTLAAGATLAVALLGVGGLASVMGWDLDPAGSDDNRGIGVPLSVAEAAELLERGREAGGTRASPRHSDTEKPSDQEELTIEELREEQAVLNIIFGMDNRAR